MLKTLSRSIQIKTQFQDKNATQPALPVDRLPPLFREKAEFIRSIQVADATRGIMNEKHLGSTFDDFLTEEGRLAEAEAVAAKRVLAFQIAKLMEEQQLSKAEMARRMSTSRAAVDRLLNSDSESATLATLEKAAAALGRRLYVALV